MFEKKKTVFVLGAGASNPYGYPTGPALKKAIIRLADKNSIPNELRNFVKAPNNFRDLTNLDDLNLETPQKFMSLKDDPLLYLTSAFERSGQPSIDEFLRTNKALLGIGKFAITHVLLGSESETNLIADKWYQLIWSRLSKGKDSLGEIEPNIAFVTFNYDTSLEYVFSQTMINTFPQAVQSDVNDFFEKMPVLHVHGKIKKLPWEDEGKSDLNKIGFRSFNYLEMIQMSKDINLFHEKNIDEIVERSKNLIAAADNIVFLGFGFDSVNVSKLNKMIKKKVEKKILPHKSFKPEVNEIVSGVTQITMIDESVFSGKRLFATSVNLNLKQQADIKKNKGLEGLGFVDYSAIDEFLTAHIDEFI